MCGAGAFRITREVIQRSPAPCIPNTKRTSRGPAGVTHHRAGIHREFLFPSRSITPARNADELIRRARGGMLCQQKENRA